MASKHNIYALLKNVEAFVKSVPVDPGARNFREWRKNRTETKKAIKEIHKILQLLKIIEATALKLPCGKIPQKQVFGLIAPCWVIPQKQPLPGYISICKKILTRQALEQIRPIPKTR
jgi:hypothetical protein